MRWVNAGIFLQIKEKCLSNVLCEFHIIWSTGLDGIDAFVDAVQIRINGKQGAVLGLGCKMQENQLNIVQMT